MFRAALASGIFLGSIYAMVASGLNLIFGVVKIINFAHGALLALGMYMAYFLITLAGFDPYLTLPVVVVAMFLVGWAIQSGIINRIMDSDRTSQLLITFGLALMVQNGAIMLWGHEYRSATVPYARKVFDILGIRFSFAALLALTGSAISLVLLYLFLHRTRTGTAIRAVSQQPDSAALAGINVKSIYGIAFGVGSAMVGVAAVFMVPIYFVQPSVGDPFVLMAFITVVLGGLGSVWGAAAAGMMLGVIQNLFATMVNVEMAPTFVFLVFMVIMFFRPYGLFGRTERIS
ncbi:MAG TPA: branched-chain amino acid ABC transporter permease [Acidimicrobiia bacterium]|nr:branched-chain amino acid ABC transporter permease [Acidimicrobiia bacterium]